MKKKIIAITAVVMTLAIAITGTIAFLVDKDSEVNTFKTSNTGLDIELIESQYHRVNAGVSNEESQNATEPPFDGYLWAANVNMQGNSENTPNFATSHEQWVGQYFSDAQIIEDAAHYKDEGGYFETHNNMLPGQNCRKNPYVKNNSDIPAYIRVRVLIPVALFEIIDGGFTYWTSTALNEGEVVSKAVDIYNDKSENGGYDKVKKVTRGTIEYYEYDFTYVDPVKPGELTFWNVWGNIAINSSVTTKQLNDATSAATFDVIFEADAIQAHGFADYEAAFAAFDAQPAK